ncbi:hypothetical protein OUZ56_022864 [Daphnia magna]|uniref:Uncharacterized protein n=1 Tax=Daphnia magna TaxID=35525 RepID=A0ABR0AXQ0_9CRUS|nr:hypothetical protein OUZ56_022864 [Daphnia magna]
MFRPTCMAAKLRRYVVLLIRKKNVGIVVDTFVKVRTTKALNLTLDNLLGQGTLRPDLTEFAFHMDLALMPIRLVITIPKWFVNCAFTAVEYDLLN